MKKSLLLLTTCIFCLVTVTLNGQGITDLIAGYTGKVEWDATNKKVTFVTSGEITFTTKGNKSWLWEVPTDVSNIYINKNTRVNGAFHSKATLTIEGEDRKTSEVYGTETRSWPQANGLTAYQICSFQNFGGTMTIKNLTSRNPRAFHVRGWGTKMMVSYCDFIDTRGGSGNHSDGVEGGDGSVFDHCYFETGDDIIKVYFNILVTNCVINMVENTVPIQLGWGDYSNGKTGTFRNLKIYGNSGRGAVSNAIINGRTGKYNVTVNIDSCDIENTNAAWVTLNETTTGLKCNVTNAKIKVKTHVGKYLNGPYTTSICGTNSQDAVYNCMGATNVFTINSENGNAVYPNPASDFIYTKNLGEDIEIFDVQGRVVLSKNCALGANQKISIQKLKSGIYFVNSKEGVCKFIKR